MRLRELQDEIGRGEYQVNTHAVADAIIRRLLGGLEPAGSEEPAQDECS